MASRHLETANEYAAEFNIPHAFADEQSLAAHPDVELVVILTPGPDHARAVRIAIAAGKDVYSEWPLSTTTAESSELLALAKEKGVRHIVGLQRRFAPSARYTRDLIRDGYVGTVRAVRMSVGAEAFPPKMSQKHAWTFDPANFTNILSVYAGHFQDMLFTSVGFPTKLTAIAQNQFPFTEIEETGEKVPYSSANEVMVIGTLEGGALFSIQIEGSQKHKTGVQIDITGTEGVLKISNPRAFHSEEDHTIEGMNDASPVLTSLPVPEEYRPQANANLPAGVRDVAYLYAAYAATRQPERRRLQASRMRSGSTG